MIADSVAIWKETSRKIQKKGSLVYAFHRSGEKKDPYLRRRIYGNRTNPPYGSEKIRKSKHVAERKCFENEAFSMCEEKRGEIA